MIGGLGNQLFQYSTAKELSILSNKKLVINKYWYESKSDRPFLLDKLVCDLNVISEVKSPYDKDCHKYNCDENCHNVIDFSYHDCNDIRLYGYFVNLNYFKNSFSRLCNSFNSKSPYVLDDNTASIHIRRGDYLKFSNLFRILPDEYYVEAIERLLKINKNMTFLVFSENNERYAFLDKYNVLYIDYLDTVHSFWKMIATKYHIIANSTFSLWASYISNCCYNAHTISPLKWYTPLNIEHNISAKKLNLENWDIIDL